MTTVEIVLALVGILAGAYAAFTSDARVAGLAAAVIGIAVLIPLVVKS